MELEHGGLRPRREVRHRLDQRRDEEQQVLQGHVLAERHEVHLAIDARGSAVGRHEEGGIVVPVTPVRGALPRHKGHRLDLIAPDQEGGARLARQAPDRRHAGLIVLEVERQGGFGPQDERRPLGQCRAAQADVPVHDHVTQRRVPFLFLREVPLHDADAHRRPLLCERAVPEARPPPHAQRDDGDGRCGRGYEPAPRRDEGIHGGRARPGQQHREAVHAHEAGPLRDRQHGHLAVAEQRPGEAAPDVGASQFAGRPHGGRQQQRARAHRPAATSDRPRGEPGEQREIRHEQERHDDGQRRRKPAVHRHHAHEPIQRAGEVHQPGRPPEQKRVAGVPMARVPHRQPERREGEPRH
jgi:hypothetical protein